MKFTLSEAEPKSSEGLKTWIYNKRFQFAGASAAYLEVTGSHGLLKNTVNDRVYYVIDGKGEFLMGGSSVYVAPTDVVIVPKGTEYDFWANEGQTLKLFLVHAPAFDQDGETRVDR
jgi:mannose-6-phosphate isomerase-like protein (cupin superfamily)